MTKTIVTILLAATAAAPAFAHPGHGMSGWLHHGELVVVAALVVAVLVGAALRSRPLVVGRRRIDGR